jgi:hypothetical protein
MSGSILVRLEQHRHRLLAHVHLAEQIPVGGKAGRKLRVVAHQQFVVVGNRLDLLPERPLVELVALLRGLGEDLFLPFDDFLQRELRHVHRLRRAGCGCERHPQQGYRRQRAPQSRILPLSHPDTVQRKRVRHRHSVKVPA